MALDDVVQGVKVHVSSDGVDEVKAKLGALDKVVSDLSKTATGAAGGQGGDPRSGIPGLSGAFANLKLAGAGAFQTIAQGVASGNLTGLATLMGGPVAGGVTTAAQAVYDFSKSQEAAILTNAAMAKQFGTTPEVMQSISDTFGKAGVSSSTFERFISRMSRNVSNDYAGMMRNIRTDSTSAAEAQLNLTKANRAVQDSFNDHGPQDAAQQSRAADLGVQRAKEQFAIAQGVPKESFAAQDKALNIKEKQLALDESLSKQEKANEKEEHADADKRLKRQQAEIEQAKALEAQYQQTLKSVPHISEELQKMGDKSADVSDLMMTDMHTLQMAFEHNAQDASGGEPPAIAAAKQFADFAKNVHDKHPELEPLLTGLMQRMGGVISGGGGLSGVGAAEQQRVLEAQGAAAFKDTGEFKKLGIGETPEDKKAAEEGQAAREHLKRLVEATAEKGGSKISQKIITPTTKGLSGLLEKVLTGGSGGDQSWTDIGRDFLPVVSGASRIGKDLINPGGVTEDVTSSIMNRIFGPQASPGKEAGTISNEPGATAGVGGSQVPASPAGDASGGAVGAIATGGGQIAEALSLVAQIIASAALGIRTPQQGVPQTDADHYGGSVGHWRGGLIKGFARGGLIRGFAAGGIADPLFAPSTEAGGPLYGDSPELEQKRIAMQIITNSMIGGGNGLDGPQDDGKAGSSKAAPAEGLSAVWDLLTGHAGGGPSDPADSFNASKIKLTDQADMVEAQIQDFQRSHPGVPVPSTMRTKQSQLETQLRLLEYGFAGGGAILPGFAQGSIKGPGTGTSDSILARLSNGEFVMKDAAVRAYGVNFMHAINNMQLPPPKYAMGGMVPDTSLPHFASGGGVEGGGTPIHVHVGDKVFGPMTAGSRVAGELRRFAIDQQTSSTGHKPSWAGG